MLSWVAMACLCGGFGMLTLLSAVDLKTRLLPNEMVLGFATLGIVFHLTTLAQFVEPIDIFVGFSVGFASLYGLRLIANRLYKTDALGLGDVKLMGAGGIWLGSEGILLAMAIGAVAGMVHGIGHAFYESNVNGTKFNLSRLQIPAGPGFAVGIIIVAMYQFRDFNPIG